MGSMPGGQPQGMLAQACLVASFPCMSYQLALAGRHLRWKPRHCIGLCMPCCVPDLHVVPASIGWEAFALETASLYWPLPALLRPALHVVPASFGWEAFPLETTSLRWPLHALLRP